MDDVRRYLDQFLMDPYVVDLPWPLRRLLVSLILIKRPAASAHAYASIWWDEGSPLIVLSRRLQATMTQQWQLGPVELAMRYGEPSIESVLLKLARQGIRRLAAAVAVLVALAAAAGAGIVAARHALESGGGIPTLGGPAVKGC